MIKEESSLGEICKYMDIADLLTLVFTLPGSKNELLCLSQAKLFADSLYGGPLECLTPRIDEWLAEIATAVSIPAGPLEAVWHGKKNILFILVRFYRKMLCLQNSQMNGLCLLATSNALLKRIQVVQYFPVTSFQLLRSINFIRCGIVRVKMRFWIWAWN